MEVHLSPERQARQDYLEAVEGVRQGHEDWKAGRVRSVEESFRELGDRYGVQS